MIPSKELFIRSFQQARDQDICPGVQKGIRMKSEVVKRITENYWVMRSIPGVKKECDECENLPVIIIGSGPSLEKHYSDLRNVQQHVCLVAVDTALPALCANSIAPWYSGVTEMNPEHTMLWQGNEEYLKTTVLILPNYAEEAIYRNWPGPMRMFHTWGTTEENMLQEQLGADLGLVNNVKSISTMLTYFAIAILGCDPIIVVGHDCAVRPGESYYTGDIKLPVPGKILGSVKAENSLGLPLLAADGLSTQTNRSLWGNKIEMDQLARDVLALDSSRRLWNLDPSSLLDPQVWVQKMWVDVMKLLDENIL